MLKKLIAIILLLLLIPNLVFAETATTTDLESLRKQIDQYQKENSYIQSKIDDLNSQIQKLDSETAKILEQQKEVQAQVDKKVIELDETLYELHKTNEKLEENKLNFNAYVRNAYKNGDNGVIDVLFSAKSFGDLIDKIETVNLINKINENIINEIEANKETINKKATAINGEKKELDSLNDKLDEKRNEINFSRANISSLVDQAVEAQKVILNKLQASQDQYSDPSYSIPYNASDEELLAHLIESEAGVESYLGKLAVGSVVINRAKIKKDTIRNIIYARNQFDGINTKNFTKEPSDDSKRAAKEVLGGKNVVPAAYYYANLNLCAPSFAIVEKFIVRIGNHWFFRM
ncbi:MAG: cell wall hydrolase [Clostridiaceae bacterium]